MTVVRQIQQPQRLRSRARPVSAFVQPQVPAQVGPPSRTNALLDLAQSLAQIEPTLRRYVAEEGERAKEAGLAEGRALRVQNQKTFAQATKDGVIPQGSNPWIAYGYKLADGELTAATAYNAFLYESWQNSDLSGQDYPDEMSAANAVQDLIESKRNEFLKQTGGASSLPFLEGFEKRRPGVESGVVQQIISQRIRENVERFEAATGQLVSETLTHPEMSDDERVDRLQQLFQDRTGNYGMTGTAYNEIVTDQLIAESDLAAVDGDYTRARELIALSSKIKAGPGGRLAGTRYARDKLAAQAIKIERLQQSRDTYEWSLTQRAWAIEDRPYRVAARNFQLESQENTRQTWQRAEDERDIKTFRENRLAEAYTAIAADPTADHEAIIQEFTSDPELADMATKLRAWQTASLSAEYRADEDPKFVTSLSARIFAGHAGPEEIGEAVLNKKLGKETSLRLLEDFYRVSRDQETISNLSRDHRDYIGDLKRDVETAIRRSDEYVANTEDIATLAIMAKREAERRVVRWIREHEGSTFEDFEIFGDKVLESILNSSRYRPNIDEEEAVRFKSPSTLERDREAVTPEPAVDDVQFLLDNISDPRIKSDFEEIYGVGSITKWIEHFQLVPEPRSDEE